VTDDNTEASGAVEMRVGPKSIWIQAVCLGVATLGRLPALGAWWNQDDWGLLARAAASAPEAGGAPARLVGQILYWQLCYPLFGLNPDPYTWSRLLLHGLAAALTARIAWRAGLSPLAQLLAGLLVAATPLVFTPLYWAAGCQELLAVSLALAAVERWLSGGRWGVVATLALAVGSILAKEPGLGLALLLGALFAGGAGAARARRRWAVAVLVLIALAAVGESLLVLRRFATGPEDAYALSALAVPTNLTTYGWWLASIGPRFAANITLPMAAGGGAFWLLWGGWALVSRNRGDRLPAAALLAALLALAPVLPLVHHTYPYLAYAVAPAGALAVAALVPRRWPLHAPLALLLAIAAVMVGTVGMQIRLGERTADGLPADPLVRRTALAYASARTLTALPWHRETGDGTAPATLLLLQPPPDPASAQVADRLGVGWVMGSELYSALAGTVGPRLILSQESDADLSIAWVNSLQNAPDEAIVLVDAGHLWLHWGHSREALLYLALTEVAREQFARARQHLLYAAHRSAQTIPFYYDPDQMLVAPARVLARKEAFIDYLAAGLQEGYSRHEVSALQEIFFALLSTITGHSVADLRDPAGG